MILRPHDDEYDQEILNGQNRTGVPSCVIKGVITAESDWDPRSYLFEPHLIPKTPGDNASYGLMQSLGSSAKALGYNVSATGQEFPAIGPVKKYTGPLVGLFDPKVNILYGAMEFAAYWKKSFPHGVPADLLKTGRYPLEGRYHLDDAAASYNMGWPRRAEDTTPIIVGIHGKPQPGDYFANQRYVDRVLNYAAAYAVLDQRGGNASAARALLQDWLKKKDSTSGKFFYAELLSAAAQSWPSL